MATVARERCGGAGYLVYNKVQEGIYAGHSSATAEGDNRVLMQKVVKDLLANSQRGLLSLPELSKSVAEISKQLSISDFESLVNLIYYREQWEIENMTSTLKMKIVDAGKSFFSVW